MSISPPAGTPPPNTPPPDNQDTPGAESTDASYREWLNDPANTPHLRSLRRENAGYRVRVRTAEQRLAALDPTGEGTISLTAQQQEIRSLKVENGLITAAHRHGIESPKLLRAYLADSLKDLDPSEPTFHDDLDAAVEEAIVAEPALRGRPANVPSKTGARFAGGEPQLKQLTRNDLVGMAPEDINAARQRGLLDTLLGRRNS